LTRGTLHLRLHLPSHSTWQIRQLGVREYLCMLDLGVDTEDVIAIAATESF